jgi:formamidopyrimidine-DNA glycosylase
VPELPDVERYGRFFRAHAAGRVVRSVESDPTILRNTTPGRLRATLRGRRLEDPDRHGKWLICWTDGPALLLHFGMTGDLVWSGDEPERHRHDRLILLLNDGTELRYRNMRKIGGVWLAHDPGSVSAILGPLGPDGLRVGRREFLDRLSRRRGGVKAALMDQSLVAGVGNLTADEILWQARIDPLRPVATLDSSDRGRLYSTLRSVLREAVESEDYVTGKRSWLSRVRGRPGATCPRCGTPLARTVAGGRTTYYCPSCQR